MTRRLTLPMLSLALGFTASMDAKELPAVAYEKFASGFVSPMTMMPYGKGDQAYLVVDQAGVIYFLGEKGGEPGKAFLDLRQGIVKLKKGFDERGTLGIALHPGFATNKKVYVYYSAPLAKDGKEGFDHTAHLSEFKVKSDGFADRKSERILLTIDQPQFNHDGGHLVFGKDGYLYLGLGDGGKANDLGDGHEKGGNGQATDRLLGKILRLDVDKGDPYGIPEGNPFKGKDGRDEIYAWGIRNPWGITVDHGGNGDLIVADVGQNRFEEIDVITPGNFGWPRYEGYATFNQKNPGEVVKLKPAPAPTGFKNPVLVFPHHKGYGEAPGYGISVTGGHVYRGKALPGLTGIYIFADWAMSWAGNKHGLYAGIRDNPETWTMQVLPGAKSPGGVDQWVVGFGQDHQGEIYVLTNAGKGPSGKKGAIWKIVPGK
ncbi:MAG: PQQ-dependent sugar dehydrogenase [Roseibacillus sp.]